MTSQRTETVGGYNRDGKTEQVGGYTRRKPDRSGRAPSLSTGLLEDMLAMCVDGLSYRDIGRENTARGLRTPTGSDVWPVSTVKNALGQYALEQVVAAYRRGAPIPRVDGDARRKPHREPSLPTDLLERMLTMRNEELSFSEIGRALQEQGLRSPTGSDVWSVSMVKNALGQFALGLLVEQRRKERQA